MLAKPRPPRIRLPNGRQDCVKGAVLHVVALVHCAIVYGRSSAADSIHSRVRLAKENDQFHEECALLLEALRIKDVSMTQLAPQRRPHFGPHERMAILELRAAQGWSFEQNEYHFLISASARSAK